MSWVRIPSLTPSKVQVRVPGYGSSRDSRLPDVHLGAAWEPILPLPILSSGSDEQRRRRAHSSRSRAAVIVATVGLAVGLGLLRRVLAGSNADPAQPSATARTAERKEAGPPPTEELSRFQEFLIRDRRPRILLLILMQPAIWTQLFEYTRSARFAEALIIPECIGIAIAIFGLIQGKASRLFDSVLELWI